jgi:antitoxin (DNA-binding transcriptional repressor) of toxin-antitoxin stability system
MITKTVDVREAQTRFPELLSSVTGGTEVIFTQNNLPIARLTPLNVAAIQRVAGLHHGSIWIGPDFNDPLPDNFWTGEA